MWGCFAFLMGLEHVNATPSSRKIPFVDINRRYVRSVGRLTSFWKIWPGKMPAEARANGFLRFFFGSEDSHIGDFCPPRSVFREEGWWKGGVPDVGESTRFSRARDDFGDTPDVPRDDEPSARGFGDAFDASQTRMPRTLFFKKKVSGKRAGRGVTLPLHGVLRQVVGLILLKIPIEQSHGVSHSWLLANMLGVKKSHVAHRFRGR